MCNCACGCHKSFRIRLNYHFWTEKVCETSGFLKFTGPQQHLKVFSSNVIVTIRLLFQRFQQMALCQQRNVLRQVKSKVM